MPKRTLNRSNQYVTEFTPGEIYYILSEDDRFKLPFMYIKKVDKGKTLLTFFYGYGFYLAEQIKEAYILKEDVRKLLVEYHNSLILKSGEIEAAFKAEKPSKTVTEDEMLYFRNIPIELARKDTNNIPYFEELYESVANNKCSNLNRNITVYDKIQEKLPVQVFSAPRSRYPPRNRQPSTPYWKASCERAQPTQPQPMNLQQQQPIVKQQEIEQGMANLTIYEAESESDIEPNVENYHENNGYTYLKIEKSTNVISELNNITPIFKHVLLNEQKNNLKPIPKNRDIKETNDHPDIGKPENINERSLLKGVYFSVYENTKNDNLLSVLKKYWLNVCRYEIGSQFMFSDNPDYQAFVASQTAQYIGLLVGNVKLNNVKLNDDVEKQTIIGVCMMYEINESLCAHGALTKSNPESFNIEACKCPSHKTAAICTQIKATNSTAVSCPTPIKNPDYVAPPQLALYKGSPNPKHLYIDLICSYFEGFGGSVIKCVENNFVPFLNIGREDKNKIKGLMLRALKKVYFLYPRLGFLRQNTQGVFPICYVNLGASKPLDEITKDKQIKTPGFLTLDSSKTPVYTFEEFKSYFERWNSQIPNSTKNKKNKFNIRHFNNHNRPLSVFMKDSDSYGYLYVKYLGVNYSKCTETPVQNNSRPQKKQRYEVCTSKDTHSPELCSNSILRNITIDKDVWILFSLGTSSKFQWYEGKINRVGDLIYNGKRGINSFYIDCSITFVNEPPELFSLYESSNYEILKGNPCLFKKHLDKAEIIWSLIKPVDCLQGSCSSDILIKNLKK